MRCGVPAHLGYVGEERRGAPDEGLPADSTPHDFWHGLLSSPIIYQSPAATPPRESRHRKSCPRNTLTDVNKWWPQVPHLTSTWLRQHQKNKWQCLYACLTYCRYCYIPGTKKATLHKTSADPSSVQILTSPILSDGFPRSASILQHPWCPCCSPEFNLTRMPAPSNVCIPYVSPTPAKPPTLASNVYRSTKPQISFVYSSCPTLCPTSTNTFSKQTYFEVLHNFFYVYKNE